MVEGFVFYKSFADAVDALPAEQYKAIVQSVCHYAIYGVVPEDLDPVSLAMFTLMRPQIDANNKRREAGRKGGEAKENTTEANAKQNEASLKQNEAKAKQNEANVKQTEANVKQSEAKEKDKVKDKEKVKERVSKDTPKKDETPEAFVDGLEEPAEVKKELLEYIAMRKKIKKPLTAHAMQINYNNLLKISGNTANKVAIIKQSIGKCWLDFYPLTLPRQTARSGTINFAAERKYDPSIEAVLLGE